ncbi:hypothetical protein CGLAMM_03965 [Acetobacteraceae bacterium EV16G]
MTRRPAPLRTRYFRRLRHLTFILQHTSMNNPIRFKFHFIKGGAGQYFLRGTEYPA